MIKPWSGFINHRNVYPEILVICVVDVIPTVYREFIVLLVYYLCNPSGVKMSLCINDSIIGITPPGLIE